MNSTYSPTNQNDDSKEEKSIKDIHTIELNYHLSDVNLLRGDFKKEELEVQHTNIEHENIKYLAKEIFSQWDLLDDGQISVDEIILCGIDTQLAVALGRVMDCDNSGVIHYEDIVNCLTILKFGTMKAKVALLVEFMDHNGDHMISYDEALTYLKAAPSEICEKLGLDPTNGKDLQFEDILALFESSDRGEEAIGVFCNHILHILESRVVRLKPMMSTVVHCLGINDVMMLYNQLATWVRHLSRENMFIAVLVALQIVLWEYNFNYYQENNYPVSFCIAKGFGLNLRILTIILFLTMARSTMAKLHSYKLLSYFVPMGFNIQIHSFVGFCTVFHALGHMSGHIVYHTYFVEGGFSHSFVQKSLLRGEGWRTKGSGDAITGFILLGALLLMAITALRRGNSSQAYKSFSLTHFLYNIWLVFLFLHVPHLWPFFLAIGALFAFERANDFFVRTTHSTLAASRPLSNGITFLSVPRCNAASYPGSYYRIKIPELSPVEWHPFSLAGNVTSHHLIFFVASVGDWTNGLHELVSDPQRRNNATIQVQGPFYAPAHTASKKPTTTTMLIASGIGITPFFSVMASRVAEEQSYESDKEVYAALFDEELAQRGGARSTVKAMKKWDLAPQLKAEDIKTMYVVWTIRDVKELMFYLDYVYELVKHQNTLARPVIHVSVYLTGIGKTTDLTYMMSQTLFLLTLAAKTSKYMTIHFGRPNMSKAIEDVSPDQVYYCGGGFLKKTVNDICIENKIPFHPEDFDAGTNFLNSIQSAFKSLREPTEKSLRQIRAMTYRRVKRESGEIQAQKHRKK